MKAAKAWGVVPPSRFYEFSDWDKAIIVATFIEEGGISAYQAEVERQKSEAQFQTFNNGKPRDRTS